MDIRGCARMNCCCVPCNISPSRPRDQCGSVRSFTIVADKTRWFLGAGDAGFCEGSPNDVVNGGMSSRSSHRPSACQRMMSTLVGDLSTLELIRGAIQQQLSRLRYLVPIRKRSMGWSATRHLRVVPSALEVWLGQAGHCIHSTQSPCHGRSAVYPRVSVVQASGPSLSEANLYGIATFPPYTCRSIPLHQGWSPRARRLMQQTPNRLKLPASITV